MSDQDFEGSSEPVDLINHPSGIVPTLQNIVSTVNLDCKLDLKAIALQARNAEYNPKRLAYYHHAFASYEPEMFPGLIYRIRGMKGMKGAQIVLLIFVSGNIVITGAKKREETYKAFENIYPVLTQFQKKFTR
ncbi:hypothetical protein HID58_036847 [Brassica napus]|uniref:TATA-box-binding protein n=1 Tax=Brassica napus TaxID=3708 RepID=A0ABQ8C8Y6_BRANA|nr:hypothetical protein HID58_036847 [Brassica napus]